jgi:hypothetical protein
MFTQLRLSSASTTLLAVLLALPAAAQGPLAPLDAADPAETAEGRTQSDRLRGGLTKAGWKILDPAPKLVSDWHVDRPLIPVSEGVALLVRRPNELPRPAVTAGGKTIVVPLAPLTALLGRVETAQGPAMEWTPHVSVVELGGGLLGLEVDVEPYRGLRRLSGSSNRLLVRSNGALALGAEDTPTALYGESQIRRNSERFSTFADQFLAPKQVSGDAWDIKLSVDPLGPFISSDTLAVSADGGATWVQVALSKQTLKNESHRLELKHLHGAIFQGRPTLFVAAPPAKPLASVQLVLQPLDGTPARSLGNPSPTLAGWRSEVTDLRVLKGDVLEVLLMVHDRGKRFGNSVQAADSWASRRRLGAEGWHDAERIALWGDCRRLDLRNGPRGSLELLRGDSVYARR